MTGSEISRDFDLTINASDTVYLGARRTQLFKDAMIDTFEFVYKRLRTGDYYDKLRNFISVDNTFLLTNNSVNIYAGITDYFHLLGVKYKIIDGLSNYTIDTVTTNNQTGVITITFENKTPLRGYAGKAEKLLVTNFMGFTNTEVYVKQISDYRYELYVDIFLKTPLIQTLPYNPVVASVVRVVEEWAKPLRTLTKGNYYGKPNLYFPKYEIADGLIKAHPLEYQIPSLTLDYLKMPVFVDPTDSFDYETVYPLDFLRLFVDFSAKRYFGQVKDFNSEVDMIKTNIVND